MPTFGSQPAFTTWRLTGWNSENNVVCAPVAMPVAGTITSLSCYFSGDTGPLGARLGVWDATGALLASSALFSAAAGTQVVNGQAWQTQNLSSSLHLAAGASVYLGWWRDPANGNSCIWSYGSGNSNTWTTANSTGIANQGVLTAYAQGVGAYATYTADSAAQQVYVDGVQIVDVIVDAIKVEVWLDGTKL